MAEQIQSQQASKCVVLGAELERKGLNDQAIAKYQQALDYLSNRPRESEAIKKKIARLKSQPSRQVSILQRPGSSHSATTRPPISQIVVPASEKPNVQWDDIAGVEVVKAYLRMIINLPVEQPQLFTGTRRKGTAILLYSVPGTGKTLIAQAIATAKGGEFFGLSSGDLTDKFIGESEQKIRAVFQRAKCSDNSVLFIDEIDSIASQRSDETQSQSSMKTELWLQVDDMLKNPTTIFVAATNKPWDLERPVLRRFPKKVYIPLPTRDDRVELLTHELQRENCWIHSISDDDIRVIADSTDMYSGSDLSQLLTAAAEMANLELVQATAYFVDPETKIHSIAANGHPIVQRSYSEVPRGFMAPNPVTMSHMRRALMNQKASAQKEDLKKYHEWTALFGQSGK